MGDFMRLKLFPLFLVFILASSCGDSDSPLETLGTSDTESLSSSSGAESFKISVTRKVEIEDDLSNIDIFANSINSFLISVESTSGRNEGGRLTCRKEDSATTPNAERSSVFRNYGTQANLAVELKETDRNEVKFECRIYDASLAVVERFEKTLRKSYVVSLTMNLRRLGAKEIDTLVLMQNSELLFGELKERLRVKTLISNEGHISTFTVNTVNMTPDNQAGESGGELRLEVGQLIGDIVFNLRGRNGGIQTKVPPRPPQNPNRGADGHCQGGGTRGCDGGQGPRGFPANDGLPGYDGGNSGSIILSVLEKTDAEITINYSPGLGSKGSEPSGPGLGGLGGNPDSIMVPGGPCGGTDGRFGSRNATKCLDQTYSGRPGAQGPLGPRGKFGVTGETGLAVRSVYINDAEGIHDFIFQTWSNLRGPL